VKFEKFFFVSWLLFSSQGFVFGRRKSRFEEEEEKREREEEPFAVATVAAAMPCRRRQVKVLFWEGSKARKEGGRGEQEVELKR
jgi:hypothetical protein